MKRFSDRIRASLAMLAVAVSPFSLMIPSPAQAQQQVDPEVLRICTGSSTGNYAFAARELAERLTKVFREVKIVPSEGTRDNLDMAMEGKCDAWFAQSDVYAQYRTEKPASISALAPFKNIYTEYVQILCPVRSGIKTIEDLGKAKGRLIVGKDGSGGAETWRTLRGANAKLYDPVERLSQKPDILAASTVKDSTDNTCMLWISGLNSPDMQSANEMSVNTRDKKPAIALIDVHDAAFATIKGPNGVPLYEFKTITAIEPVQNKNGSVTPGMYTNLLQWSGGFLGMGKSQSVQVPTVSAMLGMRKDYMAAVQDKHGRIVKAIEDAMPTIAKQINPGE